MADPYKVLGVSPNATDDQIKTAYRELAKKYHPDNYANNPLSDLAGEKMQEINEAYDAIVAQRKSGQNGQRVYGQESGSYSQGSSQFADIRRLINSGRIAEAQELLDGVANASRDAEWYFLKGCIYHTRGWLDEALSSFQKACSLNPNNPNTPPPITSFSGSVRLVRPAMDSTALPAEVWASVPVVMCAPRCIALTAVWNVAEAGCF